MSSASLDVARALQLARSLGVDRLDAQLLLSHLLQRPRSWLLAHDDAELGPAGSEALRDALERRAAGEPLAYLVGQQAFHGVLLHVDPNVLVPRPDTEVLVDWALERLALREPADAGAPCRVVDLGTGSGAIALAVKAAHPEVELMATDLSSGALRVAQANAERLGLVIDFRPGDWWGAVGDQRFDLVLSNPPYIAAGDVHLPDLRHEPMLALSPGGDGLDALRALCAGACSHLRPGGWLLLEHGYDQAAAVRALLVDAGLQAIETRRDLGGRERCTGGRLSSALECGDLAH